MSINKFSYTIVFFINNNYIVFSKKISEKNGFE